MTTFSPTVVRLTPTSKVLTFCIVETRYCRLRLITTSELLLYRENKECTDPECGPIGVIPGSPQSCTFIYKVSLCRQLFLQFILDFGSNVPISFAQHLGPFGSAKIVPVTESKLTIQVETTGSDVE